MEDRTLSQVASIPSHNAIMRSDDLRTENRHRILQSLRHSGACTRAQLSDATGLSPAALSGLLGLMEAQGIVRCTRSSKATNSGRGRPHTTVNLNADTALTATVALTIDRFVVCLANYAGKLLHRTEHTVDTLSLQAETIIELVSDAIKTAHNEFTHLNLRHVSIGFQGVTDSTNRTLLWSPILSVSHVPLSDALQRSIGATVTVNNDCTLIGKALQFTESATLGQHFTTVLFSHGVGMGLYINGRAFSGTESSALELGHIEYREAGARCRCGKLGCIEAYAAYYGIWRAANGDDSQAIPAGFITDQQIQMLCTNAINGDPQTLAAFATAGRAIGRGLSNVFTLFDPLPVALIGHSLTAVAFMRPHILSTIQASSRDTRDFDKLIRIYDNADQLLQEGLLLDAMTNLDRQFANQPLPTEST